jgi:translation initiation factor 1 (eIF-1/SUI1)
MQACVRKMESKKLALVVGVADAYNAILINDWNHWYGKCITRVSGFDERGAKWKTV